MMPNCVILCLHHLRLARLYKNCILSHTGKQFFKNVTPKISYNLTFICVMICLSDQHLPFMMQEPQTVVLFAALHQLFLHLESMSLTEKQIYIEKEDQDRVSNRADESEIVTSATQCPKSELSFRNRNAFSKKKKIKKKKKKNKKEGNKLVYF